MRPILLTSDSVNHSAPSGPVKMPTGKLPDGVLNLLITPSVVMRPIFPKLSVNHSAPSGPEVMPLRSVPALGNSVITPSVVMRPILLLRSSENHSAPSGPAVMSVGTLWVVGALTAITPRASVTPLSASPTDRPVHH